MIIVGSIDHTKFVVFSSSSMDSLVLARYIKVPYYFELNPSKIFMTDYLQDQLNARNTEVNLLEEHTHSLEFKLADMENLQETVDRLRDELKKSYSERMFLMEELESKEIELQNSALCIDKLEESISSMSLESQCEIESMKLDILALEHSFLEVKKIQEGTVQEKTRMSELIQELEVQCQNAHKTVESLYMENKELRKKLDASETNTRIFCQRVENWLEKDRIQLNSESSLGQLEGNYIYSKEMRYATIYC